MLPKFPVQVWVLLTIEFAERFGYYASMFSLFTYCTNLLKTGATGANVIVNLLYIAVPISACVASGFADGHVGRPRVLGYAVVLYAMGLLCLTVSSCPFLFNNFPYNPSWWSYVFFALFTVLFSIGYGTMKICTSPMMADAVTAHHQAYVESERAQCSILTTISTSLEDQPHRISSVHEVEEEQNKLYESKLKNELSVLFRVMYWIANVGGLFGIFVAPLLRDLDHRYVDMGSSSFAAGYYIGFAFSCSSVIIGALMFSFFYPTFSRNQPAPTYVLFRIIGKAVKYKFLFSIGAIQNESFCAECEQHDWLHYATYNSSQNESNCTIVDDSTSNSVESSTKYQSCNINEVETDVISESNLDACFTTKWISDCRVTLKLCAAFVSMPVYWLVCNQFSTNIMYVAAAVDLPHGIPQEIVNNVNTISLVVFLFVLDRVVCPYVLRTSIFTANTRIIVGFAVMCISMLMCCFIQHAILKRGMYNEHEEYVLYVGQCKLSVGWLMASYALQGIASALVDPAIMEIAYVGAPERMKGTVQGLYFLASALSGVCGLIFTPWMTPHNSEAMFIGFTVAMALLTVAFTLYSWRRKTFYYLYDVANVTVHSESVQEEADTNL